MDTSEIDVGELERSFETAYPQDILRWAAESFGQKLAVVTSFGPTGMVILHMISEIAPDTPVLTLDTGLLFPETYTLMREIEARLKITITRVKPELSVEQQSEQVGDALWEKDPDTCCLMRKIVPLGQALDGFDAWIAGIRRDQSPQRASMPIITRDARYGRIKLNPLATWTENMAWAYIRAHDLPYNKLHDKGYPTIGCWPCTRAVNGHGYSREGRWGGTGKNECGIHLAPAQTEAFVARRLSA